MHLPLLIVRENFKHPSPIERFSANQHQLINMAMEAGADGEIAWK